MLRLCLTVLVSCASFTFAAPPAPKYVGKKIQLTEQGVEVSKLLRLISDVSKVNIVLLEEPPTPRLDVKTEGLGQPWDQLLDDVVARSGLSSRRTGSVILVARPERLALPETKYSGTRISVQLEGADVRDAVELVSRGAELELGATEGAKKISGRFRNLPGEQIVALLLELADAKAAPRKSVNEPGCAAPKTATLQLRLAGTSTGTAKPVALLIDEAGRAWFVGRGGCISAEAATIKAVTGDRVVTDKGVIEQPQE